MIVVVVRFYNSRKATYQLSCYILTRHSTGHLLPLLLPRCHTLQQHTSPSQRPLDFHLHSPKQSHCKLDKIITTIILSLSHTNCNDYSDNYINDLSVQLERLFYYYLLLFILQLHTHPQNRKLILLFMVEVFFNVEKGIKKHICQLTSL